MFFFVFAVVDVLFAAQTIPTAQHRALLDLYDSVGCFFENCTRGNTCADGVLACSGRGITAINLFGIITNDTAPNQNTIPMSIGALTALTSLLLGHWTGGALQGTVPSQLALCTALTALSFNHQRLSGSLPPALSKLEMLELIDWAHNDFVGDLPDMSRMTNLKSLQVYENRLSGPLLFAAKTPAVVTCALAIPQSTSEKNCFSCPAAVPVDCVRFCRCPNATRPITSATTAALSTTTEAPVTLPPPPPPSLATQPAALSTFLSPATTVAMTVASEPPSPTAAIVGGAVGGLVALALIVAAIFLIRRRRRQRPVSVSESQQRSASDNSNYGSSLTALA